MASEFFNRQVLTDEQIRSDQVVALTEAKERAAARQATEAQIPRHLRYTRSGWPAVVPSPAEAQLLADVRRTVAEAVGILVRYTSGDAVYGRIAELIDLNARKQARKAAQEVRRALKKGGVGGERSLTNGAQHMTMSRRDYYRTMPDELR